MTLILRLFNIIVVTVKVVYIKCTGIMIMKDDCGLFEDTVPASICRNIEKQDKQNLNLVLNEHAKCFTVLLMLVGVLWSIH